MVQNIHPRGVILVPNLHLMWADQLNNLTAVPSIYKEVHDKENCFWVRPFSKTFSTDYIVVPERRRRTRFIWIQFALSIFMMLVCGTHICGVVQSGEVGRKSYGVFQQILFSKFQVSINYKFPLLQAEFLSWLCF